VLRVEHHRHDEHDDVGLAGGRGRVARGAQPTFRVDAGHDLAEAGLLGHVRAALVDGGDDGLVDVDRDDLPAVGRELGRQGQAHLAGPDDGDRADRRRLAGP